jgi:hypothetical protein
MSAASENAQALPHWSEFYPPEPESAVEAPLVEAPLEQPASDWHTLFHAYDDFENAPPLRFAINGFLQEDAITMIGGPSGHGKTWAMLAMVRALLEAEPLFGYEPFSVAEPAEKVIYLVPESAIGPFWHRLKIFRLDEHVKAGRLLCRTLSMKGPLLSLNDPRLKEAVNGAHVFLDTAIRFMSGNENEVQRVFSQQLFNLSADGARTITGAHHSPKGFTREEYMSLENVLRGSGELGAMLATCWGVKQIDEESNRIYVANVKPRDFQPCQPFIIEGRPHLDREGGFRMVTLPGFAGELGDYGTKGKPGPKLSPENAELKERARHLRFVDKHSIRTIAEQMGVPRSTVHKWTSEDKSCNTN